MRVIFFNVFIRAVEVILMIAPILLCCITRVNRLFTGQCYELTTLRALAINQRHIACIASPAFDIGLILAFVMTRMTFYWIGMFLWRASTITLSSAIL